MKISIAHLNRTPSLVAASRGVVALLILLAGCATAPVSAPDRVAVRADALSPQYSRFATTMASAEATLDSTFTASLDPGVESLTRLESSYTRTLGSDRERLRVGDSVSSTGMWGSTVRYGGMQFGTRSGTHADVAARELAATGLAVLPTVADALFASMGEPGSSLSQHELSVQRSVRGSGAGLGDAWGMVARDALGRTESITAPMIASAPQAGSGCEDFSVGLGRARKDYALASNEYGPTFANSTVVCAAPLGFTVEGHGEYLQDEVAALGVGLARPLGVLGTASLAVASSRAHAGSGWLARAGFEHRNSLFNLALRSRLQSREFREVGSVSLTEAVMQRALATIGVNIADGAHLSVAYAAQTTWSGERMNLIGLRQSIDVGQGALSMSAGHSLVDNFGSSLFVSYRRAFGTRPQARTTIEEFDVELPIGPPLVN